jgi:hypothetical protein
MSRSRLELFAKWGCASFAIILCATPVLEL